MLVVGFSWQDLLGVSPNLLVVERSCHFIDMYLTSFAANWRAHSLYYTLFNFKSFKQKR